MKNHTTLFCLLLLLAVTGHAQSYKMQSNAVKAGISSNGTMFANGQFMPLQSDLPEIALLKGSGLWFAGISPSGNLRGAINLLSTTDYQPGTLWTKAAGPALNNVWAAKCMEVVDHQTDFADNGMVDQPIPAVFGFPCKGNAFFGQYNSNSAILPNTKDGLCGFSDNNGNGVFDPDLGEFPAMEVRGCPLVFPMSELAYTVSNDKLAVPHPSGLQAMGLEVHTQAFVVNATPLEKTVFVRYKLVYTGSETLDSCYAGIYTDFGIGNDQDDYIGTSPEDQLMYAYNGDDLDEDGFEEKIPAVGVTVLHRPLVLTPDENIVELGLQSALSINDPSELTPIQLYSLLTGHLPNGAVVPGGPFSFPGTPTAMNDDSEMGLGSVPGKRRGLMTMGPFALKPGAVQEIVVAYFYNYTPSVNYFEQTIATIQGARKIQDAFSGCLLDIETDCNALTEAPEESVETGWNLFPNPASVSATLSSKQATFSTMLITDMLGRTIKEMRWDTPVQEYHITLDDLAPGVYAVRANQLSFPLIVQY
ncbi:MAG: T9SS type A sorting domain-containing protein [Saprospiraceae bacterium]|nr:T9SS type A sorting domain-containing protein [Saprospiraceae bacterium]